jgi:hypothetical protein
VSREARDTKVNRSPWRLCSFGSHLRTDVDLVIDDLTLESASFIPDSIKFVAHNDFEFVQGYATCECPGIITVSRWPVR